MVGGEAEEQQQADGEPCKFPNVRKTYWRSATWNSHSPPSVPNEQSLPSLGASKEAPTPLTLPSRHSSKPRSSLPPLQPLSIARRSFEEWPPAGSDDIDHWATPATPRSRGIKSGPEIKLDLTSVRRMNEPTELQYKRDRFAFYDKECSRIIEHIYLGSVAVAKNRETLRANGITHVLNCVGFVCPEYFKNDLVYKTLWLKDSPCEDITSLLYDVFDYFEEVRDQGGRVFVHCCQGVSRSTSLVIAYIMWREGRSFQDAFQDVKAARGVTNPNMGFACQLLQCQKRMHAIPMSPDSVLRMYRLAPHSPYDPLHLVPKTLNNPGAAALDSRGAFVIHVRNAIYVWVGQVCDPRIGQAAREAADQVVRYERAQGPVFVFLEGEEAPDFWEAFSNCSVLQDRHKTAGIHIGTKECGSQKEHHRRFGNGQAQGVRDAGAGKRRVTSYDVDFELFQRANQGGVFPPVPSSGVGTATAPTHVPAREDGWSRLPKKFPSGKGLGSAVLKITPNVPSSEPKLYEVGNTEKEETDVASFDPSLSISLSQCSPFMPPVCHIDTLNLSPDFSSPSFQAPMLALHTTKPTPVEHIPANVNRESVPRDTSKSFPNSLPQWRDNTSPFLHLPALEDDIPAVPRGMPRRHKHPRNLIEKCRTDVGAEESEDLGFNFEGLNELCCDIADKYRDYMGQRRAQIEMRNCSLFKLVSSMENQPEGLTMAEKETDCVITTGQLDLQVENNCEGCEPQSSRQGQSIWETAPESGLPALYVWPGMEKIAMFHANDLDTQLVFVLLAPGMTYADGRHGLIVYVWVGRGWIVDKWKISHLNDGEDAKSDDTWQQIRYSFIDQMHLWGDIPVKVSGWLQLEWI
eukprot:c29103_g1_i6 orf=866-3439(-)